MPYLGDTDLSDAVFALRLHSIDFPFFHDIKCVTIGNFTSSIHTHHLDASVRILNYPVCLERWSLFDEGAIDCKHGFDGSHFDYWLVIISVFIRRWLLPWWYLNICSLFACIELFERVRGVVPEEHIEKALDREADLGIEDAQVWIWQGYRLLESIELCLRCVVWLFLDLFHSSSRLLWWIFDLILRLNVRAPRLLLLLVWLIVISLLNDLNWWLLTSLLVLRISLFLFFYQHLIACMRFRSSDDFRSVFFSCLILWVVNLTNNSYLWLLISSFLVSIIWFSLSKVSWCDNFSVLRYLPIGGLGLNEKTLWEIVLWGSGRFQFIFLRDTLSSGLSHLLYICRHIIDTFPIWLSIAVICNSASHWLEIIRGLARTRLCWWILIRGVLPGLI